MGEKVIPAPPRYRLLILDLLMVRGLPKEEVFEAVRTAYPEVDGEEVKKAIEDAEKIMQKFFKPAERSFSGRA